MSQDNRRAPKPIVASLALVAHQGSAALQIVHRIASGLLPDPMVTLLCLVGVRSDDAAWWCPVAALVGLAALQAALVGHARNHSYGGGGPAGTSS